MPRPAAVLPDTDEASASARGLFLFLALSRLLFSAAALLAAAAVAVRNRTTDTARRLRAAWATAAAKAAPFFSVFSASDAAFLACLVALWMAIYAVCVWDDPAEFLGAVVSAPAAVVLGALEGAGAFLVSIPSAMFAVSPTPVVKPRHDSSSRGQLDVDALAKEILASQEFTSKVEELAARYTRPIREELAAYSDQKAEEVRSLVEAGDREKAEEMAKEVEQKMEDLRRRAEERIEESLKALAVEEERTIKMREELHRLQVANKDMSQKDGIRSAREEELARKVEGKLTELESLREELQGKVSACCNQAQEEDSVVALRAEADAAVDRWAASVVASEDDEGATSESVRKFRQHLRSEFVSRAEVDKEVDRLAHSLSAEVRAEMLLWAERNAELTSASTVEEIMRNSTLVGLFRERIAADLTATSGLREVEAEASAGDHEILGAIQEALRVYDADKTGMFDFALESAGGTIASTRCTETHDVAKAVYSIFGMPFWWERNGPRTILQPDCSPGQCWAFKGSRGEVVVKLSSSIYPEVSDQI